MESTCLPKRKPVEIADRLSRIALRMTIATCFGSRDHHVIGDQARQVGDAGPELQIIEQLRLKGPAALPQQALQL